MTRWTAIAAVLVAACSRGDGSTPTPTSAQTSTPTQTSSRVPTPPPRVPAPLKPPPPPCRALAVTGPDAGIPVGSPLVGRIALLDGERLTVKEPSTGREVILLGPGDATPCDRDMQTLVTRGKFMSTRGEGESPGAETWVVTPFAVVSYGAALVEVTVDASSTHVVVKGGAASAIGATDDQWTPVTMTAPFVRDARGSPDARDAAATATAASRCDDARAAEKAFDDGLADAGAAFGELAVKAEGARRLARVRCAIASLVAHAP